MSKAVILGTGSCLPETKLTNADLEQIVETSDEWITARTGIKERRIAGAGEYNYKLAAGAGKKALEDSNLSPEDLDLIVVATVTPQRIMPSTACFVQTELGATNCFAYDINAACTGFTYGLDLAANYIQNRPDMNVLVIGSETLSTRVDWKDRNTCVLFGDGAGAAILSGIDDGRGILSSKLCSDGKLWELLYMDGPESQNKDLQDENWQGALIRMNGSEIFKHAVRAMHRVVNDVLEEQNLTIDDVDILIPHQANKRILKNLRDRLKISENKLFINLDKYGNTSAASVPIALDEANRQGKLKKGDIVLLCTFGAGLTWGALVMRW